MEFSKYIACICEGAAEQTIINMLLDAEMLQFGRKQMIEGEPIRCRGAEKFERNYLRKGFNGKITVLRVLDSHRENFRLSEAYSHSVDVINIVTAPEIEMLVIFNEDRYNDYKKSGKKPSDYCKSDLGYSNVKSSKFIEEYFHDINSLVAAIKEYKRVSRIQRGEYSLADLLK